MAFSPPCSGIALQHIAQALAIIAQVRDTGSESRPTGIPWCNCRHPGTDRDRLRCARQALNRLGRTGVDTLPADNSAIDRMRADRSVVIEIPRLLELAAQALQFRHQLGTIRGLRRAAWKYPGGSISRASKGVVEQIENGIALVGLRLPCLSLTSTTIGAEMTLNLHAAWLDRDAFDSTEASRSKSLQL